MYFRSCLYHQLIAAYAKFGVSGDLIFANYLPALKFDGQARAIECRVQELFSEKEIETWTGLHEIRKKFSEDPISETVRAIDRGLPVLVAVDGFALPYREDLYGKAHNGHYLLVYGYDLDEKRFTVNEHAFENSYRYRETEMPFGTLEDAHRSYREHCGRYPSGIIKVRRVKSISPVNAGALYLERMLGFADVYRKNAQAVRAFREDLLSRFADLPGFFASAREVGANLTRVRNMKSVQKFQLGRLLPGDPAVGFAERISECLSFIAGVLAKAGFSGRCGAELFEKVLERCAEWAELEEKLGKRFREAKHG